MLPAYAVANNHTTANDGGTRRYATQGETLRASTDAVSNVTALQRVVPSQAGRGHGKRDKYLSFGAAIVAGILLSILANALHAWMGLTVLCVWAQKMVPPSAFDQFSIPYLSSYTLASKEFLTFLIVACIVETVQKFVPGVSHLFNILNGAVKPVLTAVMIGMIAKFANPDISNLMLRPMEILGGATVFGLHFGKHVIKWPTASIPGPHTLWAVAELIAVAVVVGLGVWVLV